MPSKLSREIRMLSERSKKSIADYFRAKPEIAAAYVFGSSSTGRDRAGSDIDIAIMVLDRWTASRGLKWKRSCPIF